MVRSPSFRKNTTFLQLAFSKSWHCTAVLWKNAVWWLPEVSAAVLSYIRHETIFPLTCSSTTTLQDLWASPGSHMREKEMYTVFSSSYSFQEKCSWVNNLVVNACPIFPLGSLKMVTTKHWIYYTLNNLASKTVTPALPWNVWLSPILK